MTTPPAGHADALAPVRAALLRAARADADAALAEARRTAEAALDDARAQAAALLEEARRQGEEDGKARAAQATARARHTARARQLAARGAAYAQLRRRVGERARDLRNSTEYPALRERLATRARDLLGPQARITEHRDGGVTAEAPGRRVDLGLDALAARALDRLGAETEQLWAP